MIDDLEKTKEKRRIFCVITQSEMGGAQQFVTHLARHLDFGRFELHVAWGSTGDGALGRTLPDSAGRETLRHLVRQWSPAHDLLAIRELRKRITHLRPDILLCISSKAGFIGALAARPLRKTLPTLRVIYRIGGWSFNDPLPSWRRRFYLFLERFSARFKDIIVVNSTHDLEQAKALRIRPRSRLVCIYNGIDPYMRLLPREQARTYLYDLLPERTRASSPDWLIGTIANLYPTKDIAALVHAAARVGGNVKFMVIGDGQQRGALEQLIEQMGLQDRFFLLGQLPQAWQYLPAFDVFVLSSLKEGFPWAILEAMAAKIPIVATRVGAVPEILTHRQSGMLADPGRVDQIAQGIVDLLSNDRLRQDVAIDAHQQLITRFSMRTMIDQYERLLSYESTN